MQNSLLVTNIYLFFCMNFGVTLVVCMNFLVCDMPKLQIQKICEFKLHLER